MIGVLEQVGAVNEGKKNPWQEILIRMKAPTDTSGIARGDDKIYPVVIFGKDTIEKTWRDCDKVAIGSRVAVKFYMNSTMREGDGGRQFYNIQLKLKEMRPL